jgi:hypothetical protein
MFKLVRHFIVVFTLALAISALTVGSAFAAKGGNTSSPTLTVSPNPAPANSVIQVSGCGYTVGAPTELVFYTPTATDFAGIPVDSNGCIATYLGVTVAGSYSVQISQDPNNKWVQVASGSLTVQ